MKKVISAIDIGSSKIKILVVAKKKDFLELVYRDEENSEGVKRGTIIEPRKVSQIIRYLIEKTNQKLKEKVSSVYINLSGTHLFSTPTRNLISVSRADQIISDDDIERVLREAKNIEVGQNKEILEVIPKEFIVDGERGIKEPRGLKGRKLEIEGLALGYFTPYFENLNESISNSGLDILGIIPGPLAAAKAVLTERQKDLGVCLLDIGAETTSLAVFEENSLIHLAVLPMGSLNISNDIAIVLKIDPEIAEKIKIEYGSCFLRGKNTKQKIEIGEEKPLVFSQGFLTNIVKSRFLKIFSAVLEQLKKISKEKSLPAGIIFTGGGAKIPGILELARGKFQLNCKLGRPRGILGLEDDPVLATVAGLILEGIEAESEREGDHTGFFSRIKKVFKIFLP